MYDATEDVNDRWEYAIRRVNKNPTIEDILKFAANNPDRVTHNADGYYSVSMPNGIYNVSYEPK